MKMEPGTRMKHGFFSQYPGLFGRFEEDRTPNFWLLLQHHLDAERPARRISKQVMRQQILEIKPT